MTLKSVDEHYRNEGVMASDHEKMDRLIKRKANAENELKYAAGKVVYYSRRKREAKAKLRRVLSEMHELALRRMYGK